MCECLTNVRALTTDVMQTPGWQKPISLCAVCLACLSIVIQIADLNIAIVLSPMVGLSD